VVTISALTVAMVAMGPVVTLVSMAMATSWAMRPPGPSMVVMPRQQRLVVTTPVVSAQVAMAMVTTQMAETPMLKTTQ